MKNKTIIILGIILLIAAALRFWHLGKIPGSIDWDEASLGYNAYSILQTGKDEYGKSFPVILQSFGDYKPALYAYTAIPFIELLGLTPIAIRLPSVLCGILIVLATYLLVQELFDKKIFSFTVAGFDIGFAELAALLTAISPYAIQFSRIAFESNLGLMLNMLGALFFIKGVKSGRWFLLSAILFALSIYSYQSEKVFVPLLVLLLFAVYFKKLWTKQKKYVVGAAVLGLLLLMPMILFTLNNKQALARAQGVSVFNNGNQMIDQVPQRLLLDKKNNDILGEIFDNRRVVFAKIILGNYLSHFDLRWLFLTGDSVGRHQPPEMGHLYFFELPLLLIGIFTLFFYPFERKTKIILFGWLLVTPVAASVTFDVPNAVRVLNFVPILEIFSAIGVLFALKEVLSIKHQVVRVSVGKVIVIGYSLLFVVNIIYYINQYFVQYNYFNAGDWQYGYAQAVPVVKNLSSQYDKVIVSDVQPLDQSYIFFLFYLKYPSVLYQQQRRNDHDFGKYQFENLSLAVKDSRALYVGRPADFPASIKAIQTIYDPNGAPAIKIVDGKSIL